MEAVFLSVCRAGGLIVLMKGTMQPQLMAFAPCLLQESIVLQNLFNIHLLFYCFEIDSLCHSFISFLSVYQMQ
jgi:hypothetical protein